MRNSTGVITGTVTNETTGEPLPGLTVELGIFDTTALLGQQTAVSDANGVYSFTELDTDPGLAYVVRTDYPAGVPYNTDFVSFGEGETSKELSLAVFETTNEAASRRPGALHRRIQRAGPHCGATAVQPGRQPHVHRRRQRGVSVSLPAGAQNVEIDGDDEIGSLRGDW